MPTTIFYILCFLAGLAIGIGSLFGRARSNWVFGTLISPVTGFIVLITLVLPHLRSQPELLLEGAKLVFATPLIAGWLIGIFTGDTPQDPDNPENNTDDGPSIMGIFYALATFVVLAFAILPPEYLF